MTMMFVRRPSARHLSIPHYDAMIARGREKWAESMRLAVAARRGGMRSLAAEALGQAACWRGWTEESLRMRREALLALMLRGAR